MANHGVLPAAVAAVPTYQPIGFAQKVTVRYYRNQACTSAGKQDLYAEGTTATACRLRAKQLQAEQLAMNGTISVVVDSKLLVVTKPVWAEASASGSKQGAKQ